MTLFPRFARRAALAVLALVSAWVPVACGPALAQSRIKDIAEFESVRGNMLIGYGLVVGLNGSGDKLENSMFTRESLIGMLERLGVNSRSDALKTKNVAAVMVTATFPAFARQGNRIDVNVSTMGDATSLLGGTLLVTPLLGADAEVYAVAQGSLAVAGFSAGGAAQTVVKGVPTTGRIANGAIVEKELGFDLSQFTSLRLMLRNPDFTTARRVAQSINGFIGQPIAKSLDNGTIQIVVPQNYPGQTVALMTDIEQLPVSTDQVARVVIDETTGVIVMGENVRISTVAIAQGNLTVRITETPQVSQPEPFSNTGRTVVVPRTDIQVDENSDRKLTVLPGSVTLQELVNGLNAMGIGPRDLISILQAIKAAGAMQAEIVAM